MERVASGDGKRGAARDRMVLTDAALHSTLTLRESRVRESNYHDYRVLRLQQMPLVEVHNVPSTEKMGGAGEPGAPAVANAVFALTGQCLRELPLRLAAAPAAGSAPAG